MSTLTISLAALASAALAVGCGGISQNGPGTGDASVLDGGAAAPIADAALDTATGPDTSTPVDSGPDDAAASGDSGVLETVDANVDADAPCTKPLSGPCDFPGHYCGIGCTLQCDCYGGDWHCVAPPCPPP